MRMAEMSAFTGVKFNILTKLGATVKVAASDLFLAQMLNNHAIVLSFAPAKRASFKAL